MRNNYDNEPILFAEHCPQEPKIMIIQSFHQLHQKQSVKVPRIYSRVQTNHAHKRFDYTPQPNKSRKSILGVNFRKSFEEVEHQRQLKHLKQKLKYHRCIYHSKKDNQTQKQQISTHLKDQKNAKNSKIQDYYQKIAQTIKNRKKPVQPQRIYQNPQRNVIHYYQQDCQEPQALPQPKFHIKKQKRQIPKEQQRQTSLQESDSLRQEVKDLPRCSAAHILSYIFKKNLFKFKDLKILHSRLLHYYPGEVVFKQWRPINQFFQVSL